MASLYPKKVSGKTYWYLREMARVDGKPKMVSERYLGTAADIATALEDHDAAMMPQRTRHLAFGDVAAVWGMTTRLDVIGIVDEVTGGTVPGMGASIGTYLALAALNRVVAPCSKAAFAGWWKTTAADRFTKIPASVLDHRRFWDAMNAVTTEQLEEISRRVTLAMIEIFDVDTSALALDMTNFATYIDTANTKAPIAQRGKAKQKRADLRLVGLGLVVTRDGGVPLVWHAYPGNRPDVTQFTDVIDLLTDRYRALAAQATSPHTGIGEVTVVFDAGQNSTANFAHLAATGLRYVGSVPPSDHPDLLALPPSRRQPVDVERFPGVTALATHREIYGAHRRVVLTHSPTPHTAQARGFDQTLAKTTTKLATLADTLARGKTRRHRDPVTAEIQGICHDTWAKRVITWELTGDTPAEHRLAFAIDTRARATLEKEVFGKRILITDAVSFSPMHHWTDHNIRVHVFTCVLALQIAHLLRRQAHQHGLTLSVRALLERLAGIGETVLIYPSTGGRPKARRMLTEHDPDQRQLAQIFELDRWAPHS
jgi:transposase